MPTTLLRLIFALPPILIYIFCIVGIYKAIRKKLITTTAKSSLFRSILIAFALLITLKFIKQSISDPNDVAFYMLSLTCLNTLLILYVVWHITNRIYNQLYQKNLPVITVHIYGLITSTIASVATILILFSAQETVAKSVPLFKIASLVTLISLGCLAIIALQLQTKNPL